jgi:pyruvate kinase
MSLREALADLSPEWAPAIVAKIETRPAVEDMDAILGAADAVMVARGDLGVELPFEEVPMVQKRLVQAARAAERPVIVATQMLESMVASPRPTRAEASDVANATLEGADAVMLSAETAIGAFPIEAARAAMRIVGATDSAEGDTRRAASVVRTPVTCDDARAIAQAAVDLAGSAPYVKAIACFTRGGRTATLLAGLRPPVPILAFSPDVHIRRRLSLVHGVLPRRIDAATDQQILEALYEAVAAIGSSPRSAIVLVATTAGGDGRLDLLEIVRRG